MLVLKRALSLAISTALAFPVNVWARSEQPHAPHAKPAHTKGFVAVDKPVVPPEVTKNSKGAKAAKTAREIASSPITKPSKQMPTHGRALASVMPKSGEKKNGFEVYEVKGKGKRLKSRVITKGEYREVLVDEDGDGTADVWEVTDGPMSMKAYRPYKGRFTQLEYTERRAKGQIRSIAFLDPQTKRYILSGTEIQPYRRMNSTATTGSKESGFRYGEMCESEKSQFDTFEELLAQIQKKLQDPKIEAIQCKLDRYQDAFFDKSCDTADFKTSKADMISGLAQVMGSGGSTNPSRYLQCLQDNGYGFHAAKIQQLLGTKLTEAQKQLKDLAQWDDDQFMDPSCERLGDVKITEADGRKDTEGFWEFSSVNRKEKKLFSCEKQTASYAYWDDRAEEKRVKINATSDRVAAGYKIPAADAYGSIIFHELLHSSGITDFDEKSVGYLQICCGPSSNTDATIANTCKTVRERSLDEQLLAKLNNNAGFGQLRGALQLELPQDEVERYTANMATSFRKSAAGQAAIAELKACETRNAGNEVKLASCKREFKYEIGKYAHGFIKTQACPDWKRGYTAPNADCEKITQISDAHFEYDENEIIVRARPTATASPIPIINIPPPVTIVTGGQVVNVSDGIYFNRGTTAGTLAQQVPQIDQTKQNTKSAINQTTTTPTNVPNQPAQDTSVSFGGDDVPSQPSTTNPQQPTIAGTQQSTTNGRTTPTAPTSETGSVTGTTGTSTGVTNTGRLNPATTTTGGTRVSASAQIPESAGPSMPPAAQPLGQGDTPLASAASIAGLGTGPDILAQGAAYSASVRAGLFSQQAGASQAIVQARNIVSEPYRGLASVSVPSSGSARGLAAASVPSGSTGSRPSSSSRSKSKSDDTEESDSTGTGSGKSKPSKSQKRSKDEASEDEAQASTNGKPDDVATEDVEGPKGAVAERGNGNAFGGNAGLARNLPRGITPAKVSAFVAASNQPTKMARMIQEFTPEQMRAVLSIPSSREAFATGKFGIEDQNGKITGYSNPPDDKFYKYCGDKIVLKRFCR